MIALTQPLPPHALGDFIAGLLYVIATASLLVFLISYVSFFRWTKTAAGRVLALLTSSLILLSVSGALNRWLGRDYFGRDVVADVAAFGVAAASVALPIVLWRAWRRHGNVELSVQSRNPPTSEVEVLAAPEPLPSSDSAEQ